MTDVSKTEFQEKKLYFEGEIKEASAELSQLQSEHKQLKMKHHGSCQVDPGGWSGDNESYGKHLSLKGRITSLLGKLEMLQKLLAKLLKSGGDVKTAKPKDPSVADGCGVKPDGSKDAVDCDGDKKKPSETDPTVTNTPTKTEPTEPVKQYPWLDKAAFQGFAQELLGKTKGQKISEEQLHYATTAFMIKHLHGDEALKTFTDSASKIKKDKKNAFEEMVTRGLRALKTKGVIDEAKAKEIQKMSRHAAQLDTNVKELSGHKDDKSSMLGINRAVMRAFEALYTFFHNTTEPFGKKSA